MSNPKILVTRRHVDPTLSVETQTEFHLVHVFPLLSVRHQTANPNALSTKIAEVITHVSRIGVKIHARDRAESMLVVR